MQRNEASRLIRDTFENSYDEAKFRYFIGELFPNLEERNRVYSGNLIKQAFSDAISSYKYLSKYIAPDKTEIAIIAVKLKSKQQLEKARSLQRNFVSWFMDDRGNKEVVIAAFYTDEDDGADWRFSFVTLEKSYDFETHKATKLFSPAKRYSYLVGPHEDSHTAQQQLVPLLEKERHNPTLQELQDTFAVEKISDEFFEKYKGLYLNLMDEVKKVIARDEIVREEFDGKIPLDLFCKKLLGQIVFLYFIQKKGWLGVGKNDNWGTGPRDYLRGLFKEAKDLGKNYFNDYLEPLFYKGLAEDRTESGNYYDKLDCKIPFLNGGLFDPVGGYDWIKTDITIPNSLFSSKDDEGILDVFDRYNFTVKEDEPLEKEVAIDPEMLGKVFENLLEIKDRKSKGAFYTPREIVHYMCQESLISYLQTKLGDKTKLEDLQFFIKYGDAYSETEDKVDEVAKYKSVFAEKAPTIESNALEIDNALANVKICDPAVGSGAFPVGLMHEIIRARNTLLNCGFINGDEHRTTYEYKRAVIQDSIYGVDIEASAIEVAKLRLWLSLVVDEDNLENIKPLPNLDYKMVCGNSLLGLDSGLNFFADITSEIEKKKEEFFDETDKKRKTELKQEITGLLDKLTDGKTKIFDFKVYFSEVWKANNGFDIVIGNPPYFKYKGDHKDEIDEIRRQNYFKYCGSGEINAYRVFVAMSFERLISKNGIFSMIFQNSFLGDASVGGLRKYVLNNHNVITIDSFPERDNAAKRVFKNVKMSVCILLCIANKPTNKFLLNVYEDRYFNINFSNILELDIIKELDSKNYTIPMLTPVELPVLQKMYKILSQKHVKNSEGEIHMTANKHLLLDDDTLPEVLKGAAIQRYYITKKMSQGKREFLNVLQYEKENSGARSTHHNFNRIVMQGMTGVNDKRRIIATIIPKGLYLANSCNYALAKDDNELKYILGVLNSNVINWIFKKTSTNSNVNCYEITNLPVPEISDDKQQPIIDLVDKILNAKNADSNADTSDLESQIDTIVYEIYGLTKDEISIVEGK